MGVPFEAVVGADASWDLILRNADGSVNTGGAGAAALSAVVWAGDDQATLFAPTTTWVDALAGHVLLSVAASQTSGLTPGLYKVQLSLALGGQTSKKDLGLLRLLAAPGSGTAPTTYCSYDDMRRFAPWIGDLQSGESDETGFAEQRARARTWLHDAIVSRDRPWVWGRSGRVLGEPGFLGTWNDGRHGDLGPSKWLRDQLDAGYLMTIGPRYDKVREMTAKKSLGYVLEAQLPEAGQRDYATLADRFHREAEWLLAGYVAELDLNGDGQADYWVRVGVASAR
jgi:hypothetical protein